ncbi:MAG: replication-relaxation family protein [Actinomycetota bacterium]|nr:replication-relaxation family protein [Actinomycetota bacterium]
MTPEPGLSARALKEQADELTRRLDARERAVLLAIYQYKVLVTEHLKAMFFGSLRRAQDRLRNLAQRGLIDAWYPPLPRGMGKASGHHTLTESGALVVASLLGIVRSELRYVVRDEEDREQDSYLAHRLGVNEFFCALIEAGRQNDGHGLAKWVPERTVRTGNGWIRPDGYGVYLHRGGALDFYLEYDRGTETTRQLANKLAGYIGVARDWTEEGAEHFPCVLIVVSNQRRERVVAAAFADALARFKRKDKLAGLPFFVANEDTLSQRGVLGKAWAPLPKLDRRLAIRELPAREGLDYDLSECIGRCFTEDALARLMPLSHRPRFPVGEPPCDDEEPPEEGVVA